MKIRSVNWQRDPISFLSTIAGVGQGSLYQRGKTWWIKYHHNGKPVRESTKSDRKMVARKLLEIREGEIAQGKLPSYLFEKVTFDELAEDLLTDYRVNGKKTLEKAARIIRLHLQPFFGGMRAPDISSAKVKEYIGNRIEAGAQNATVNRELSALKRMLNLGAQQTPPKVDRVPHITMLKENNVRKGFFERKEFERFHSALPEHLRGFVTFAYKTGWRRGEIAGLTWDRIDRLSGVVRLESGETKSGEARTIYLDNELKDVIAKQFSERNLGCTYVFHINGRPIGEFRKSWTDACESAELPDRLFHDLRRTAVRNMVRAGIPERIAMMISGHKTRSVFDRYNIVSDDDLRQAARRQAEYLENLE